MSSYFKILGLASTPRFIVLKILDFGPSIASFVTLLLRLGPLALCYTIVSILVDVLSAFYIKLMPSLALSVLCHFNRVGCLF
jgi:hypothetical protein